MKKFFKWLGIVVGGLLVIIVIILFFMINSTNRSFDKIYSINPEKINFPTDSVSIEKGKRLAGILCSGCHGEDYSGTAFFNVPELAVVNAPNITSGKGGEGGKYSNDDWVSVIRHGVMKNGKAVFIMPSKDFNNLSDNDLGNIIAYLKTVSPVDKNWERDKKATLMAKVLTTLGAFGNVFSAEVIDHTRKVPSSPEEGPTAEYGNYLVSVFGCRTCHGQELNGGKDPNPQAPFAPNLTPGGKIGTWTSEGFINLMRTGITPEGKGLSIFMPWKELSKMNDDQLRATFNYLRSLPKKETAKL